MIGNKFLQSLNLKVYEKEEKHKNEFYEKANQWEWHAGENMIFCTKSVHGLMQFDARQYELWMWYHPHSNNGVMSWSPIFMQDVFTRVDFFCTQLHAIWIPSNTMYPLIWNTNFESKSSKAQEPMFWNPWKAWNF